VVPRLHASRESDPAADVKRLGHALHVGLLPEALSVASPYLSAEHLQSTMLLLRSPRVRKEAGQGEQEDAP
jgi:hypothetical protein